MLVTFGYDSTTCITYSTDYYQRLTLESWFTNLQNKRRCLYLPLLLLRTTTGVCASGVTDETDIAETCTDVDWISLVACASGFTGETILAGTSSGVDGKTRVACTMGVTEETVVAWSCTEVGGTTCVAGASDVAGTRVVL